MILIYSDNLKHYPERTLERNNKHHCAVGELKVERDAGMSVSFFQPH
jgi:hypothetical protein